MTGLLRLGLRFATRTLRRGGQRTVLAVFCIAVGVMAVVALRLAADMVTLSLTGNVRAVNGGDVHVESGVTPLTADQLAPFDRLRRQGVIQSYLPIGTARALIRGAKVGSFAMADVIDTPADYPPVGSPQLVQPHDATFAQMLAPADGIVLSKFLADDLDVGVGSRVSFSLEIGGGSRPMTVTGILRNTVVSGPFTVYISGAAYRSITSLPERYAFVDVLTGDAAQADRAAALLREDFPSASVRTVQEALDANLQQSSNVTRYLQLVGLLALLIGGIGIVNTMQVSLSRRRLEIAMLKTSGYRRRDLYALFSVEAALLGLAGGVLGTVIGIGISALVRSLLQRVLLIDIVFHLSAGAVVTGLVVGVVTALIFGMLPIVRAAAVRPQAVLRDMGEGGGVQSGVQTAALYALLVVLFSALSATLLGSVGLAVGAVLGIVAFLAVLAGVFSLIVAGVGRLPVPERVTVPYLLLVTVAVAATALVTLAARAVGVALMIAAASGYLVLLLPRRRRTAILLALRAMRRTRARTATTAVALFVGVFTIGLILVLAQDITATINDSLTKLADFSVFGISTRDSSARLEQASSRLPGLVERRVTEDLDGTTVITAGGRAVTDIVPPPTPTGEQHGRGQLELLRGVEGYDLAGGQTTGALVLAGRDLGPSDADTSNVLVRRDLQRAPFSLQLGDEVTLQSPDGTARRTVRIAGFYAATSGGLSGQLRIYLEPVLASRSLTEGLGGGAVQTIVAMRFDPRQKAAALEQLQRDAPGVAVLDLADIAGLVGEILGDLVILLVALASLALFAGVVIIANAVALAMLERRREIGILKAVGHTSGSVLSQVLIENGVVGAMGAIAGMAVVTAATYLLGKYLFKTELAVGTPVVLIVIGGIVALAVLTAAAVAWGPTRARPLEVLRYE